MGSLPGIFNSWPQTLRYLCVVAVIFVVLFWRPQA